MIANKQPGIRSHKLTVGEGTFETFHNNGLRRQRYIIHNNQLSESMILYDRQGVVKRSIPFVNGHVHGLVKSYNHGNLVNSLSYEQGRKHGVSEHFDPEGNLLMTIDFYNDQRHGQLTIYDKLGHITKTVPYSNDKPHGMAKTYDAPDHIIKTEEFAHGKHHGRNITYYPNGNVHKVEHYNQGKLVEPPISIDQDGKVYYGT